MITDRLEALCARGRALARAPRATGPWYRISNVAAERATVDLYGVIGDDWDGVTAATFVKALRGITASAIDLHINSPGGFVFDGVDIYSALKDHPATVDVMVGGLAASAASFVAMAGDTVTIQKPAKFMIHDAQGLTYGGPAEHRKMLDLLDELSDTIAEIYADRAGGPVDTWREAMTAETWYGAEQAVAAGLADRVAGEQAATPANRRSQMIRARARVTLGGVR